MIKQENSLETTKGDGIAMQLFGTIKTKETSESVICHQAFSETCAFPKNKLLFMKLKYK